MADIEIHTTAIDQEAPRIEFPCDYPIKVMGMASEAFAAEVVAVIERHAPGFDTENVTVRASAKGNYLAVTVVIQASGEAQLRRIFEDLKQSPAVKMVL
ncbi:MAG: hypothetical protein RLZZ385_1748 [Pseudomonadota bacterium]|jgi:putative lipoic acid-binding regulatory protein